MDRIYRKSLTYCSVPFYAVTGLVLALDNQAAGQVTREATPIAVFSSPSDKGAGYKIPLRPIDEAVPVQLPTAPSAVHLAPPKAPPKITSLSTQNREPSTSQRDSSPQMFETLQGTFSDRNPKGKLTSISGQDNANSLPTALDVARIEPDIPSEITDAVDAVAKTSGDTQQPAESKTTDEPSDGGDEKADDAESDEDYTTKEEYEEATKDTVATKQEYGEKRTDNTRAFLRAQTPLLKPGQWQIDYGLTYSILEADFPVLLPAGPIVGPTPVLTSEQVKLRNADAVLGFRYGVNERLQWAGSTTVGWQGTEFADGFFSRKNDASGIGDLLTGFNYLICSETDCTPAVIASANMTAPTGNPRSPRVLLDSGTGLGVWTFSSDFLMVKSYDPLVMFWGAGYRWLLEGTFHGERVNIGDSIQYNFGTGFGVNERVTLSCTLLGAYDLDTRVNSVRVPGTGGDAISIRMAATMLKDCKIVEPFVTFGLTQRVPEAFLGVIWTR